MSIDVEAVEALATVLNSLLNHAGSSAEKLETVTRLLTAVAAEHFKGDCELIAGALSEDEPEDRQARKTQRPYLNRSHQLVLQTLARFPDRCMASCETISETMEEDERLSARTIRGLLPALIRGGWAIHPVKKSPGVVVTLAGQRLAAKII